MATVIFDRRLAESLRAKRAAAFPDLAVGIVGHADRSRVKVPTYSQIGTRELSIVDRDAFALTFQLVDSDGRPSVLVARPVSSRTWSA